MTGAKQTREVDVCLVVEGCYPYILGGVSSWLDWLMRSQPETSFGVVALVADDQPRAVKYDPPDNLAFVKTLPLAQMATKPPLLRPQIDSDALERALLGVLGAAQSQDFTRLLTICQTIAANQHQKTTLGALWKNGLHRPATLNDLLNAHAGWQAILGCYEALCPQASFVDFFWAWRSLVGGLFSVLGADFPSAGRYHAISTGYAGLYAAAAAETHDRPFLITEHGIYTNERQIDVIMADWIPDTIARGCDWQDPRRDIRDFWIESFSAYARIAYARADQITTLYQDNQKFQIALGADPDKLRVIPNGIDIAKFAAPATPQNAKTRKAQKSGRPTTLPAKRPTLGLLGRVVPIKDIEGLIEATALIREAIPDVDVIIMGPTDEDPVYYEQCKSRVRALQLEENIRFTGRVDPADYLPQLDVMVLTSISEAQPLVLLEAGAAGIPCIATNVGSCQEIIEGASWEVPKLGEGGRVVPVMDARALADAAVALLDDPAYAQACGDRLCARVNTYFTSQKSAQQYRALFTEFSPT